MSTDSQFDALEFPCPGPITAEVKVGAGVVTVTAEDSTVAVVTISPYDDSEASHTAAANTKVKFTGDRLRVQAPESAGGGWIFRRGGRVRVDIRLPLDSHLWTDTGSADVRTHGRLASATVHTGSGDISVGEIAGDLSVNTGSGDVRAGTVGGALRVDAASGDIAATSVGGQLLVDVASGDVGIDAAGGPVRASSASGDISIGSASGGHVQISSASGDVSVGVPAGTRVWLDLSTMSGTTTSDLAMSAEASGLGAQLRLEVRTMSGDISVRRVTQPMAA